jgi:hypothetical protein
MRIGGRIVCAVLLAASGACRQASSDASACTSEEGQAITGTVRYVNVEGGFYGIETDDGKKLDPVNLPDRFKQDGLAIRARIERLPDQVSFHMWGELVRILAIEPR